MRKTRRRGCKEMLVVSQINSNLLSTARNMSDIVRIFRCWPPADCGVTSVGATVWLQPNLHPSAKLFRAFTPPKQTGSLPPTLFLALMAFG
jgi:hypothetical protein